MKKIYSNTVLTILLAPLVFFGASTQVSSAWVYVDQDVPYTVSANQPPVVNAGVDQSITLPTSSTTLNGTATDSDGTITNSYWLFQSGPVNPIVGPNTGNFNNNIVSVTGMTSAGTYVFSLTAQDNGGAFGSDTMQVVVGAGALFPDLVGSTIFPITATVGVSVQFQGLVTNQGTATASGTFYNLFQLATAPNGGGTITSLGAGAINTLAVGASQYALSNNHTFSSAGSYSVRVCADMTAAGGVGAVINENTNEGNNCGGWQTITVSNASTQCSDGVDNGDPEDVLADTNDPGCHSDGNAGNPASYDANDDDETDVAGPPECSDGFDNFDPEDVLVDKFDPGCINPGTGEYDEFDNDETDGAVPAPDLIASNPSPSSAVQGVSTTISSTISNTGTASTGIAFTNLFQFDNNADHGTVTATQTVSAGPIAALGSQNASVSYTFATTGTWYVRACADNDASWNQTISESDEGNNCSGWTTVTVDPAVVPINGICGASHWNCTSGTSTNNATGASSWTWDCMGSNGGSNDSCVEPFPTTQCSDGVDNGDPEDVLIDMGDPGCSSPADDDETDTVGPPECSDGIDNADAEDVLADTLDPGCHTDGNENNPASYDANDDDETNKKKPIFIEF